MSALTARLDTLHQRWRAFSPRERAMLGLMAAAIAAFVYAYGLALPLSRWAGAAQARHQLAIAEQAQVQGIVAAIAAMPAPSAPASAQALADSARALGLEVESADQQASGQVHITLAPAAPDLVFAWIEQQRLAGQPPRAARLRSGDGGVAAELDF
tara:strand:+ start:3489 stop:3956 length:468 start_codon:yes stop_codon:yes gene_type:complete